MAANSRCGSDTRSSPCGSSQEAGGTLDESVTAEQEPAVPTEPHAVMETDRGTIVIRLLPDLAPMAVENFIQLSENGFYTRTVFHRILPSKMIQGQLRGEAMGALSGRGHDV